MSAARRILRRYGLTVSPRPGPSSRRGSPAMKANGCWRWPSDRAPARNVLRPAELISRGAWFAPAAGEVKHLRKTEDLPQLPGFDHTLAFLRSGYAFVGQRCDELGTDRFATRLMLRPVICARGEAAAELVYDAERVTRQG